MGSKYTKMRIAASGELVVVATNVILPRLGSNCWLNLKGHFKSGEREGKGKQGKGWRRVGTGENPRNKFLVMALAVGSSGYRTVAVIGSAMHMNDTYRASWTASLTPSRHTSDIISWLHTPLVTSPRTDSAITASLSHRASHGN